MTDADAQAAASRSLVRHPDFVKLWTAETISVFGTQITLLALPLIAALTLNVTPFEFGLLGAIDFLPFILLSLPAGVWVDRLRRRPILIAGDIIRGTALLSLPIAFFLDALTIGQLYIVGFINGCATVFFDVAYQSYLPALVDRDQIVDGNSKLESTRSAAQIVGPGISGFLIGAIGAPFATLLDSLSFGISAFFIGLIRRREPKPERQVDEHGRETSMRTEIAAGLRYVTGHPYLRNIAITTGTSNFFSNIQFAVLILFLTRQLAFTPELIGVAFSIGSVGFLLGALLAGRVAGRIGVGPTIVGSAFVFGPSALMVAIAPESLAFPFIALSIFIGSLGGAIYNINQVSLRQAITPLAMQGRMNATMRFIVWGTIPIGAIVGGFLGGLIGLHETIWVAAIGGLFVFLPVLLSPVRSIREMPAPVDDAPSTDPKLATEAAEDNGVVPAGHSPYLEASEE
ncbi:MAG TPA: MFS transporter [Candidatus Limnocylindrales bacterium]|nr:MFS transporter [Candidatus Limnocylindrales bacterium]